jgi:RHS repeat-associated protein
VFSYDSLNQLVSARDASPTQSTYEWDAEQRLTAVVQGTKRSEISYDGFGRRARIREKVSGVVTNDTTFLWAGVEICESRDSTGSTTLRKLFPQGEVAGNNKYFYTKDHLGSVREVVDSAGNVVSQYAYDPYGKRSVLAEAYAPMVGFAGYFIHAPSAINFAVFRGFRADIARWISRDPLQERGGLNLYAYVGNNSINRIDPLGLQWDCRTDQSSGRTTCTDPHNPDAGLLYNEVGYSGSEDGGRNNPALQDVQSVGPLPRGKYTIAAPRGTPADAGHTGPNTMNLTPADGGNPCANTTRDCNSFRIHGDNATHTASQGCLILPPNRVNIPPGSTLTVFSPDAGL